MVFTGIVQAIGRATWGADGKKGRLHIQTSNNFFQNVAIGGSVAVSGVCLTAVNIPSPNECYFDVMEETLRIVSLNGEFQNLELPMALGDPVGGHTVTGHVDTTAVVTTVTLKQDGSRDVWFRVDKRPEYRTLVVYKGSIGLHGTSLTIASLEDENSHIRVSLIPHTLAVTILGQVKEGDRLNIEFDHALKIAQVQQSLHAQQILAGNANPSSDVRRYSDEDWMERALALSLLGQYTVAPNPIVGCVVIDPYLGRELGYGFHVAPGTAHAEVVATEHAIARGEKIEGATMYTTLEPCTHTGRTGPCAEFIIKMKFARVVIGVEDVDERVAGKGVQALRDAGIAVTVGVLQERILQSPLRFFLHHRTQKRPFVTLKVAPSLDGATACSDSSSKWITGTSSREDAQHLRMQSQAIAVGSQTVLMDHPSLTVRQVEQRLRCALRKGNADISDATVDRVVGAYQAPARVVFDSTGESIAGLIVTAGAAQVEPILREHLDEEASFPVRTYVILARGRCLDGTRATLTSLKSALRVRPCSSTSDTPEPDDLLQLIEVEADRHGRPCVKAALKELAKEGIVHLMVEGGATLSRSFFEADVVDELVVYVGAALLGSGSRMWGASLPPFAPSIAQAKRLQLLDTPTIFDNDVRLRYRFTQAVSPSNTTSNDVPEQHV